MSEKFAVLEGCEAAATIAFKCSEVCAIYPITPSSNMGEYADQWAAENRKNLWGTIPSVVEMQSEGGAAGAVHGALQSGALATTFTASQGLLLMIPNMYKIAGELTPTVFHVSARSLACQALSIFGDHSDIMAVRSTGFALLCSASVQEVLDMALVAHAATLESRIPFVHFFDGFRTSHEVNKITMIPDEAIRQMIRDDLVTAHRARALSPDHPVLRGTAQNPDVYFQGRETVNPFYAKTPEIVQRAMDQLAKLTGRAYKLFDYHGAPDAERVLVLMGSGAEAARETLEVLRKKGEKVGLLSIHLFRPFSIKHFIDALPRTVKTLAVLDRTKEPGAAAEPLYQDVLTALAEAQAEGALPMPMPRVFGGRYGLSSKEFTPAMVKAVFDEAAKARPKNHFTVGIVDDVSHTSLDLDAAFVTENERCVRAMFFGLGADGTVGANKNSIKIIGEETDNNAQGYFVYDSKKSGSQTVSHLRFGPDPIRSTYLIQSANFIGCHQFNFLEKSDVLRNAAPGAVFLLNSPFGPDEVWDKIPGRAQKQILDRKLKFYVIDAYKVARETGMGTRINTVMQTCFFAISGVLPREEAIAKIKGTIKKTYGKKGEEVVKKNFEAVDQTLANLFEVPAATRVTNLAPLPPVVSDRAPDFVKKVTAQMMAGLGDDLPVSAMPVDGTFPTGTTKWEKRGISPSVPVWEPELCIQCGHCGLVCPHSVIRMKQVPEAALAKAPASFKSAPSRDKAAAPGLRYILQLSVEDCTGCTLCVGVCPAKSKSEAGKKAINMADKMPVAAAEAANLEFFEGLDGVAPPVADLTLMKDLQYLEPLFEYSGACTGCGETPYLKILSQMFGDRLLMANATGCSSIYGGNLPTTPWAQNAAGRGPAWSNSLFEDNAEFGFGFRLSLDKQQEFARELVGRLQADLGGELAGGLIDAPQNTQAEVDAQRGRVAELKQKLAGIAKPEAKQLLACADELVRKSVWIIGGDGWAYDIGYGGLDHVIASGRNVKILVLDTEVYSNTGGQMSKSTPRGAVAKFAASGKKTGKKDLGLLAMAYGNVYVARVALGANPRQTLRALAEAEAYNGPALIIAYSHCIAHGIDMSLGFKQQKMAVDSGYWPLYRYHPALAAEGKNPFQLDSRAPTVPFKDYAYNEVRYRMLLHSHPQEAERLLKLAQEDVVRRWKLHEQMAGPQAAQA
jgi:pyruvate-ferredoxin/flavodoxin oxidoreductase